MAELPDGDSFEWNGKLTIDESYKGPFDYYEIEKITLHGKHGEKLYIFTEDPGPWAIVDLPDKSEQ